MIKSLVLSIATLGLVACVTPYSGNALTGSGAEAVRLNERLLEVKGQGNAQTPPARVLDYVKLKSAEETLKYGYTHFAIIEAVDTSRRNTAYIPGMSTTTASAFGTSNYATGQATTYNSPAYAINQIHPGQIARVIMLTADEADITAFDAQLVWDTLAPKYITD